ncbi:MAG: hypothetical protein KTR32_21065, partial [Granulosicoccus sp.]|nr:hypothetical protein [Granulosicoccus sp.]
MKTPHYSARPFPVANPIQAGSPDWASPTGRPHRKYSPYAAGPHKLLACAARTISVMNKGFSEKIRWGRPYAFM